MMMEITANHLFSILIAIYTFETNLLTSPSLSHTLPYQFLPQLGDETPIPPFPHVPLLPLKSYERCVEGQIVANGVLPGGIFIFLLLPEVREVLGHPVVNLL